MTPKDKQKAIRARRAAMKASGKRVPKKRRPPVQRHPHGIERSYYAAIARLTAPYFREVERMATKILPRIIKQRDGDLRADEHKDQRTDATYGEMIAKTFDNIELAVARKIESSEIRKNAETFGRRVSEFNRQQVDRQFKTVLGLPVLRQEQWLRPKLTAYVENNVSLIKDITTKGIQEMRTMVMAEVEAGASNKIIAAKIKEKLEATKRRARFIARDQVSKFNGKLTELRQKEAGVTKYIWRSTRDGLDRVSHLNNDGRTFSWNNPPHTGHPGEDFQCRCTAEPILSAFITGGTS